jgi:hypothetical protein
VSRLLCLPPPPIAMSLAGEGGPATRGALSLRKTQPGTPSTPAAAPTAVRAGYDKKPG